MEKEDNKKYIGVRLALFTFNGGKITQIYIYILVKKKKKGMSLKKKTCKGEKAVRFKTLIDARTRVVRTLTVTCTYILPEFPSKRHSGVSENEVVSVHKMTRWRS